MIPIVRLRQREGDGDSDGLFPLGCGSAGSGTIGADREPGDVSYVGGGRFRNAGLLRRSSWPAPPYLRVGGRRSQTKRLPRPDQPEANPPAR